MEFGCNPKALLPRRYAMRNTLILILSIMTFQSLAFFNEEWKHDELNDVIIHIHKEPQITPSQLIKRLNNYSQYAKEKRWLDTEVLAASQLVGLYSALHQYDNAENVLDEFLAKSLTLDDKSSYIFFLSVELEIFDIRSDRQGAKIARERYKNNALKFGNQEAISYMYSKLAQSLRISDELSKSLISAQAALKIAEEIGHLERKALALSSIAKVYEAQNNYEEAVKYNHQILSILLTEGDKLSVSILYNDIGMNYLRMNQFESAEEFIQKSLELSTEIQDEIGVAYANRYLAETAIHKNELSKAEAYYKNALTIFDKYVDSKMRVETSIAFIELLLNRLNRPADAQLVLISIQEAIDKRSYKPEQLVFYKLKHELEKKQNRYDRSLSALEQVIQLEKDIHQQEKESDLQQLMVKYEADKIDADNQLLQQENELKQLRIIEQKSKNMILTLVIAIVLTIVSALIIILLRQLKIRNKFKTMALHDELTNAPNRRAIMNVGQREFDHSKRSDKQLTIALLDIDHFKNFNDIYGHDVGDEVLKLFSDACRNSIRSNDEYGRFGGEEWLIVLRDAQPHHIEQVFSRIKDYLTDTVSSIEQLPSEIKLTFSLGATQLLDTDENLETLIKRADDNLYKAKNAGRNQFITDL